MMTKHIFNEVSKEDLKNLTREQLIEKYPLDFAPFQSAGSFKDRSFLDRINPFTPFSKKKFVPSENAKALLNKYKERTGKNLIVLPISAGMGKEQAKRSIEGGLQGMFKPYSLFGGSEDPINRYVYLNPEEVKTKGKDGLYDKSPGLFTLAHEAYHSSDPTLLDEPVRGKMPTGIRAKAAGFIDFLTQDKTDLDKRGKAGVVKNFRNLPLNEQYMQSGQEPLFRYQKELDAQIGAAKDFDDLGIEGFNTKNVFLPDYPREYVKSHMDNFKDFAYRDAQGYDESTDTYGDTGFQTVRNVQKQIPDLEQQYINKAMDYEREKMSNYIKNRRRNPFK